MNRCVDCCNLNICSKRESYINEYWCDKNYMEGWKKPTQKACDEFTEAYNRTTEEKNNAIKGISDGCFIVTMACELLGRSPAHDIYLQKFKEFKMNYLMKQKELRKYLVLYEKLGPSIAHRMKNYDHGARASIIARNLYNLFLPEVLEEIEKGNHEEAFKKYFDLVSVLAKGSGFKIEHKEKEQGPIKSLGTIV